MADVRTRKFFILVVCAALAIGLCGMQIAQAISIGSYDGSVSSRPFTGSDYSNARTHLLNPANFGAGGVVSEAVSILPAVSSVSGATLAGVDIFVITECSTRGAAEVSALTSYVMGGGNLLVVEDSMAGSDLANQVLSALDGTTMSGGGGSQGSNVGAIIGATPALAGPFAAVGPLSASLTSVITPGSALVGTVSNSGALMAGEILPGALGASSGAVLAMGDVLFMNFFVPPATLYGDDVDNANYLMNWVAGGGSGPGPTVIPEPATMALGLLGLVAIAVRKRRAA